MRQSKKVSEKSGHGGPVVSWTGFNSSEVEGAGMTAELAAGRLAITVWANLAPIATQTLSG